MKSMLLLFFIILFFPFGPKRRGPNSKYQDRTDNDNLYNHGPIMACAIGLIPTPPSLLMQFMLFIFPIPIKVRNIMTVCTSLPSDSHSSSAIEPRTLCFFCIVPLAIGPATIPKERRWRAMGLGTAARQACCRTAANRIGMGASRPRGTKAL